MAVDQGTEAVAVEASNQVSDSITAATSSSPRCVGLLVTGGDGQELLCASNVRCRFGVSTTQVFETAAFIGGERTECVLVLAGHGILRGRRDGGYMSQPTPARANRLAARQVTH